MRYNNVIISLAVFYLFSCVVVPQANAAWNVWLDHSIKKYRQDGEDGTSGSQSHSMKMARNEFEGFQVMIYADSENLNNVDISVSNFTKDTDTITDVYIYKEHYVNCPIKSREEYETGYYPDALLPKVDRFYNETRSTFPFNVANGKVQGVWVDIGTEMATVPGKYTATVTISASGKEDVQLPVTLEVFDFALPSTATYPATYVMRMDQFYYGHGKGREFNNTDGIELMQMYNKIFLYHRAVMKTAGDGYSFNYTWNSSSKTLSLSDWEPWESVHKSGLNGTAITSGPYAGAKASITYVGRASQVEGDSNIAPTDKGTAYRQYLQHFYDFHEEKGWKPFTHLYVESLDEPRCDATVTFRGQSMSECEAVKLQAQDVNSINTHGAGKWRNTFVHTHNQREGITDFYEYGFYSANFYAFACNSWDKDCQWGSPRAPRDQYPNYPNDRNWPYLACDNNGCDGTGSNYFSGQIDLSVDAPSMYNRLISFNMWKYEGNGTFYWDTGYHIMEDPYYTIWGFGSNGDGHLLYPGITTRTGRSWSSGGGEYTPAIGGVHDIPIASMRWKYIRDWQEDLEYMELAKTQQGKAAVDAIVNTIFTNTDPKFAYWNLNTNPENLLTARNNIAQLINGTTSEPLTINISKPTIE